MPGVQLRFSANCKVPLLGGGSRWHSRSERPLILRRTHPVDGLGRIVSTRYAEGHKHSLAFSWVMAFASGTQRPLPRLPVALVDRAGTENRPKPSRCRLFPEFG